MFCTLLRSALCMASSTASLFSSTPRTCLTCGSEKWEENVRRECEKRSWEGKLISLKGKDNLAEKSYQAIDCLASRFETIESEKLRRRISGSDSKGFSKDSLNAANENRKHQLLGWWDCKVQLWGKWNCKEAESVWKVRPKDRKEAESEGETTRKTVNFSKSLKLLSRTYQSMGLNLKAEKVTIFANDSMEFNLLCSKEIVEGND